jgi:hypothetical protein
MLPNSVLLRSPRISSSTNAMAASGVLNVAARPAAAPAAVARRRPLLAVPNRPERFDATVPASWTEGPSRPRLDPPPTASTPATNFTHATRIGT